LFAPCGKLILDEIISGDDGSSDLPVDDSLDTVFPRLIERDAVNVPEVDRFEMSCHPLKVRRGQFGKRGTVLGKSAKYCFAVFFVG
jgi:hypothetical protein